MNHKSASTNSAVDGKPEKVVVHLAYPLRRKQTLVAVARAKQLQDEGNEVVVSYCNSWAGTCAVNYTGSPAACFVCRTRARTTAAAAELNVVPLEVPSSTEDSEHPLTLQDRRELAEGVQSGITTTFRTMMGEVPRRSLIDMIRKRYYRTALGMLHAFDALVRQQAAGRIEVFNGRQACSRFCLITSRRLGIPFNTLEVTTRQRPIVFHGHTAHDRARIQQRILQHPAEFSTAEGFYSRRRLPADNKFAKQHAAGFQPPSAEGYEKRVSIFLSSQDEFESLGAEWVSPFLDYAPIVERACRENPDYLFCIRFHPNQADIVGDVLSPFQAVGELPNVQIYEPTDTANTYTLIEWSDVVVTFGSTVTIEACWMEKPVIMLGPSRFDELEISHNPQTVDEFVAMLRRHLQPGNRDNAARFAHYEEFDQDELQYVRYTGSNMVPQGIQLMHPWLCQLMRTSDNVLCRAIKWFTQFTVRADSRPEDKTGPRTSVVDARRAA